MEPTTSDETMIAKTSALLDSLLTDETMIAKTSALLDSLFTDETRHRNQH